jgi:hypothetical protein
MAARWVYIPYDTVEIFFQEVIILRMSEYT